LAVLENIVRRDRVIVAGALAAVVVLAWAYVLTGAGTGMSVRGMASLDTALGQFGAMDGAMAAMATPAAWSADYAAIMVAMWWAMMVAMMLPSAAPMILLFAASNRRRDGTGALLPTGLFAWGYVAVWGGFSIAAAALQWAFETAGILSPMTMSPTTLLLAGAVLLLAGLYQLTPAKQACLRHCRSPLQFLMGHWRSGRWGAFRMGVEHGAFCLGCCWGLMALLFFGGIMNLYWIAGLALLVLLEKTLPAGATLGRILGGLLGLWGAAFVWLALT
jgi:predicted metal-binding membrane protein